MLSSTDVVSLSLDFRRQMFLDRCVDPSSTLTALLPTDDTSWSSLLEVVTHKYTHVTRTLAHLLVIVHLQWLLNM